MIPALRNPSKTDTARDNSGSHGGRVKEFAIEYGLVPDHVIDFSSNISPIGPPISARRALDIELARIDRYPDNGDIAEQAIADYANTNKGNILMGNGSVHLIYILLSHFRPKRVMIFSPTFSEYERAAYSVGANVTHLPLGADFSLSLESNCDELREADMVFICNPNNPSGTVVSPEEILSLKSVAVKARIVVDEAFMDFLDDGLSVISRAIAGSRLIVLRSMGKFFSLAGLRVGYLVSEDSVVAEVGGGNPPWMVSNLACAATAAALTDKEFIAHSKKAMASLRDELFKDLCGINGLHAYPSQVNYFLIKATRGGWDSEKIQDHLAKDAILIRKADDFVYLDETHFRIAVKSSEDNKMLVDALRLMFK